SAARQLLQAKTPWTALEADWVQLLAEWEKRRKTVAKAQRPRRARAAAGSSGGAGGWSGWGAGVLIFFLIRLIVRLGSPGSSARPTSPNYQLQPAPLLKPPQSPQTNPGLPGMSEELQRLLKDRNLSEMEREKRLRDLARKRVPGDVRRQGSPAAPLNKKQP